jgi:hypothetical protein
VRTACRRADPKPLHDPPGVWHTAAMRAALRHLADLERRGNQRTVIRHLHGDGHEVDAGIGDPLCGLSNAARPQPTIRQRTDGGNVRHSGWSGLAPITATPTVCIS